MSDKTESKNKLTTVKTVYARAAMLLLAVNFCLTTYVVVNLNKSVQMQVDEVNGVRVQEDQPEATSETAENTTAPPSTQDISTEPSQ